MFNFLNFGMLSVIWKCHVRLALLNRWIITSKVRCHVSLCDHHRAATQDFISSCWVELPEMAWWPGKNLPLFNQCCVFSVGRRVSSHVVCKTHVGWALYVDVVAPIGMGLLEEPDPILDDSFPKTRWPVSHSGTGSLKMWNDASH